jgi:hypothetical protein
MPSFTPPTVNRRNVSPADRLFSRLNTPTGVTVLKQPSGAYVQVEFPSPEQINAAAVTYLGGHVYEVDEAEAASLLAAGYEVTD